MFRILLTFAAILAICGCNKEPQRGPIATVREKTPVYRDNDVEYDFYLDRRGRKVAHGKITVFYGKSNKVYFRGENKDDKREGEWTEYAEDGKKMGVVSFKDGMVDGSFKAWYANGQLKVKGQNSGGVQVGEWVYYNDDGQMTKTETWKNGEKISTVRGVPSKPPTPTRPAKPEVKDTPTTKEGAKTEPKKIESPVKKEAEPVKDAGTTVKETAEPAKTTTK